MHLAEFIALHVPALERDEVRHNLILGILSRAANTNQPLVTWTLGDPGACAIKWPGRAIILGEVTPEQGRALAEETRDLDYAGVIGTDPGSAAFAARAAELGITFAPPVRQRIQALDSAPVFPVVAGWARDARAEDGALLADWIQAFEREAVPHDPPTPRAALEKAAGESRHLFWTVDGMPVSVAGIARRLKAVAAIAPVYTLPGQRAHGFAGAATASLAARLFAEGKSAVCLYTNIQNVAANRCYAKIGFRGVCESALYYRQPAG